MDSVKKGAWGGLYTNTGVRLEELTSQNKYSGTPGLPLHLPSEEQSRLTERERERKRCGKIGKHDKRGECKKKRRKKLKAEARRKERGIGAQKVWRGRIFFAPLFPCARVYYACNAMYI